MAAVIFVPPPPHSIKLSCILLRLSSYRHVKNGILTGSGKVNASPIALGGRGAVGGEGCACGDQGANHLQRCAWVEPDLNTRLDGQCDACIHSNVTGDDVIVARRSPGGVAGDRAADRSICLSRDCRTGEEIIRISTHALENTLKI